MTGNTNIVAKSAFWAGIEQYATQGIQFISGIIMARLLMPSDYGILAMIYLFTDLSLMLVDMGFTTALIRKQNCDSTDYSTVFYTNIVISIIVYITFCLSAGPISNFYSQKILVEIIPIIGLSFIINALYSIPSVQLTKNLQFNEKAKISIISSVISTCIAIYLAYNGYGVWALVLQSVSNSLIKLICYIISVQWIPKLVFSWKSMTELFNFGSKVLGGNILFVLYQNLYSAIIGRLFNSQTLGYFSRADGYAKLIPLNTSTVLMKIMLPIISKFQNDDKALIQFNNKIIIITSFIIFPACMLLASTAEPLITVMITDKWLPCVPLLQILCLGIMVEHIAWINWDFILVKGESDAVLKNRILTFIISITALLISFPFGIKFVALSKGISSIFTVFISIFYIKKFLSIKLSAIFPNLIKIFILSSTISLCSNFCFNFLEYSLINLIIIYASAVCIYLLISLVLLKDILFQLIKTLKK